MSKKLIRATKFSEQLAGKFSSLVEFLIGMYMYGDHVTSCQIKIYQCFNSVHFEIQLPIIICQVRLLMCIPELTINTCTILDEMLESQ